MESHTQISTEAWQVTERRGTGQVGPVMNWQAHNPLKGTAAAELHPAGGDHVETRAPTCQSFPLFKRIIIIF